MWYSLIPGHTKEHQKTAKILSPSNFKKIIPSYELFMLRKVLLKQTQGDKDFEFSSLKVSKWFTFVSTLHILMSQIVTDYITIVSKMKESKPNPKARTLNLLIDLRYIGIINSSYMMILITALWS